MLLLSGIIYLIIAFFSLVYRKERGAFSFALLMIISSVYSFAYYFELHSQSIEMLKLLLRLEYLGTVFIAPLWLTFVLQYTGRAKLLKLPLINILYLTPLITLFLMNSPWYYFVYSNINLLISQDISIAVLERNMGYWLYMINFNVTILLGNIFLLKSYFKSIEVYKNRFLLIFIGSLFPWIALIIHIFNNNLIKIDLAPFGLIITGFIFLYNLLNFNIFNFMSLARKEVFEFNNDGIIVFDSQYKIVDFNSSAARILNGLEKDVLGQNVCTVLGKYPDLVQAILTNTNVELEFQDFDKVNYYNLNNSKIYNKKSRIVGLIATLTDNTRNVKIMKAIKANETELVESEEKYRLLVTQMQQGLAVHELICDETGKAVDYRFLDINASYENLTGLKRENVIGRTVLEILPGTEDYWIEKYAHVVMTGEALHYENYSRELGRYYEVIAYSLQAQQFAVIIIDITERKNMEKLIFDEKEKFKTTLLSVGEGVISTDNQGKINLMNQVAEKLTGWTQEEARGLSIEIVFNTINELTGEKGDNPVYKVLGDGVVIQPGNHTLLISKDGIIRPIEDSVAPIKDEDGNINGVVLVFRDFTERKEKQKKIEYLSYHDQLTGLYNRRFFEEELQRRNNEMNMPMTLVMADINGLKLTNDAFGHEFGDKLLQKAASIMTSECRADDIISRIGGDEFVFLFPNTYPHEAESIVKRMRKTISNEKVDSIMLSVSFGWETKHSVDEEISTVFKKAEDRMYRRKLSESSSIRNKTIKVIIKTLYEKNAREEQHSVRVGQLCAEIGVALGLSMEDVSELKTVGLMHDIGKITLDERLLDKPSKLDNSEWLEIKRHSETGYRILSSVNEFSQLAEYVLAHHERWDGKGYPKGLKGEEIPLAARIIAIADAYDAMTCDRPYRPTLSKSVAMEEMKRLAGTQFDPIVARVFVERVLKNQ